MTISIIMQDQYSHRNMRTPLSKGMESHLTLKKLEYHNSKQNKGLACRNKLEQIHMIEIYPIPYHASVGKIFQELLEFPPIKLPKLSGYAIWCWGYRGSNIYLTQTNNSYIQAVSIRQHITKKPSEIVYLNLRKASVIRVMAILPNPAPVLGGVEVISSTTA